MMRFLRVISVLPLLAACGSAQTTPSSSANAQSAASGSSNESTANSDPKTTTSGANDKVAVAGGTTTTGSSGSSQTADDEDKPYRLTLFEINRPAFAYSLKTAVKVDASPAPTLTKVSEKKSSSNDANEWLAKNGLRLAGRKPRNGPEYPKAPAPELETNGNDKLHYLLDHGDHSVLMYGANFGSTTTLLLLDQRQVARGQFDFSAWVKPLEVVAGQEQFTKNEVMWAQKVDDVLYVSTTHHTFAKSSKGKNAFISAIGVEDGELRWQSESLVCNAENFVIRGGYIICGYGFTDEPDFLYVISRADGKTVSKTPLKNGPNYLIIKGNQLFVRTYDTDYVFDIK